MDERKKIRYKVCRQCGRKLTTRESQEVGFGPKCYQKHLNSNRNKTGFFTLFRKEISNELHSTSPSN